MDRRVGETSTTIGVLRVDKRVLLGVLRPEEYQTSFASITSDKTVSAIIVTLKIPICDNYTFLELTYSAPYKAKRRFVEIIVKFHTCCFFMENANHYELELSFLKRCQYEFN